MADLQLQSQPLQSNVLSAAPQSRTVRWLSGSLRVNDASRPRVHGGLKDVKAN